MESIFNGMLEFQNPSQLVEFGLNGLTKEKSLKIIEVALLNIQRSGGFSFEESFIIYQCINKLNENEMGNISNDDIHGDTNI
jgi:hypothetical protein